MDPERYAYRTPSSVSSSPYGDLYEVRMDRAAGPRCAAARWIPFMYDRKGTRDPRNVNPASRPRLYGMSGPNCAHRTSSEARTPHIVISVHGAILCPKRPSAPRGALSP